MSTPIVADLTGRVVLVTGANTGMGKATAQELARLGATVVMACRSVERGEAARAEIAAETGSARLEVMELDLASQASIRAFAAEFTRRHPRLDVLVNNAAAWWTDRATTADGIERQWAVNVLGPFLLTNLLLDALRASGRGRIVNVSSQVAGGLDLDDVQFERRPYGGVSAYNATKQAVHMLTWAFAERLEGTGVTANALNPGLVNTEFNRNATGIFRVLFTLTKLFAKTARDGADTAIWLAASPDVEGQTGRYFDGRREKPAKFRDPAAVARLWALCAQQTGGVRAATPAIGARPVAHQLH